MRSRIAAALGAILIVGCVTAPATSAEASQTYHITGTDIGIMFRSDPNNWESRSGPAGYDGDDVTLECVLEAAAVGPYDNRMWYWASTSQGSGYLPDRFVDTPIKANEWLPDLRHCDEKKESEEGPKSVFFSGTDIAKGSAAEAVSDKDYALSDWKSEGDCQGGHIPAKVPDSVNTLAGWSRGRIGVVYFLANATEEQRGRIHRIILFDPGSTSDIAGSLGPVHRGHGCDFDYDVNNMLATWLQSDGNNRLTVITGIKSEMKKDSNDTTSESTFAGLWKYYFAGIWNQPFADRALVCDYNAISHEQALSEFAHIVKQPRKDCASAPSGHALQAWHP